MSFADRLIHSLSIVRQVVVTDEDGNPVLDDYGQPTTTESTTTFKGLPQPKTAREVALTSNGGVTVTDFTLYLLMVDVASSDQIKHIKSDCPVPDDADLPDSIYEPSGAPRNAGGIGHHLEVDCKLVA